MSRGGGVRRSSHAVTVSGAGSASSAAAAAAAAAAAGKKGPRRLRSAGRRRRATSVSSSHQRSRSASQSRSRPTSASASPLRGAGGSGILAKTPPAFLGTATPRLPNGVSPLSGGSHDTATLQRDLEEAERLEREAWAAVQGNAASPAAASLDRARRALSQSPRRSALKNRSPSFALAGNAGGASPSIGAPSRPPPTADGLPTVSIDALHRALYNQLGERVQPEDLMRVTELTMAEVLGEDVSRTSAAAAQAAATLQFEQARRAKELLRATASTSSVGMLPAALASPPSMRASARGVAGPRHRRVAKGVVNAGTVAQSRGAGSTPSSSRRGPSPGRRTSLSAQAAASSRAISRESVQTTFSSPPGRATAASMSSADAGDAQRLPILSPTFAHTALQSMDMPPVEHPVITGNPYGRRVRELRATLSTGGALAASTPPDVGMLPSPPSSVADAGGGSGSGAGTPRQRGASMFDVSETLLPGTRAPVMPPEALRERALRERERESPRGFVRGTRARGVEQAGAAMLGPAQPSPARGLPSPSVSPRLRRGSPRDARTQQASPLSMVDSSDDEVVDDRSPTPRGASTTPNGGARRVDSGTPDADYARASSSSRNGERAEDAYGDGDGGDGGDGNTADDSTFTDAILQWLDQLNLPQYGPLFSGYRFTVTSFIELTNEDLEDIGVEDAAHRALLLRSIQRFRDALGPQGLQNLQEQEQQQQQQQLEPQRPRLLQQGLLRGGPEFLSVSRSCALL